MSTTCRRPTSATIDRRPRATRAVAAPRPSTAGAVAGVRRGRAARRAHDLARRRPRRSPPASSSPCSGPTASASRRCSRRCSGCMPLVRRRAPRCSAAPPGHANHDIGYLPQRRSFDAGLRVRGIDVVRLGLDGDRWGVPLPGRCGAARARRQRAGRRGHRARRRDRLRAPPDRRAAPAASSSGCSSRRRSSAGPSLLLLDEPLDSLDLPNQAAIAALIARDLPRRERRGAASSRTT